MQQQRVTLRELVNQLQAEAARVPMSELDAERRERLSAILLRIDEIRVKLGMTDS